ncbi:MAG: hypothetical protein U0236_21340 [Nitrospira sp.]
MSGKLVGYEVREYFEGYEGSGHRRYFSRIGIRTYVDGTKETFSHARKRAYSIAYRWKKSHEETPTYYRDLVVFPVFAKPEKPKMLFNPGRWIPIGDGYHKDVGSYSLDAEPLGHTGIWMWNVWDSKRREVIRSGVAKSPRQAKRVAEDTLRRYLGPEKPRMLF